MTLHEGDGVIIIRSALRGDYVGEFGTIADSTGLTVASRLHWVQLDMDRYPYPFTILMFEEDLAPGRDPIEVLGESYFA